MRRPEGQTVNTILDYGRYNAPVLIVEPPNMPLACVYARKSRKTLLKWVLDGKIYGEQPDGAGGDWVVDRESIDRLYNARRDRVRAALADAKGGVR